MNVITVIGNGFDLQLGLPTRYSDFFKWLKKDVDPNGFLEYTGSGEKFESSGREEGSVYDKENKKYITKYRVISNYTIEKDFEKFLNNEVETINEKCKQINIDSWWTWYFLYIKNTFKNWADIEKEIENLLCSIENNDKYRCEILNYGKLNCLDIKYYYTDNNLSNGVEQKDFLEFDMLNALYYENNFNIVIKNGYSEIFNIRKHSKNLLSELKKFEVKFIEYINYIQSLVLDGYEKRSEILLEKIFESAFMEESQFLYHKSHNLVCLNFNYTQVSIFHKNFELINVHGSEETRDIIFGIDENCNVANEAKIFKKTYRKMFITDKQKELPETCDYLIFFGHSLADADYSYFQSLFDFYDIYGGKIKLLFFVNDQPRNDNPDFPKENVEDKT
ncbi:MAG: bacteriophage abortive infection AbiH family protein, partial [Oscillospiraceae bacterium]|nr:bacteriophage abortive infection AbiH family protein [Oscillospiraceae bacterium]